MSSESRRRVAVALAVVSLVAACGKKGDPTPRPRPIPQPAKDLALVQRGHDVLLQFSYPATTLAGLPLQGLESATVYTMTRPAPMAGRSLTITDADLDAQAKPALELTGADLTAAIAGSQIRVKLPLADSAFEGELPPPPAPAATTPATPAPGTPTPATPGGTAPAPLGATPTATPAPGAAASTPATAAPTTPPPGPLTGLGGLENVSPDSTTAAPSTPLPAPTPEAPTAPASATPPAAPATPPVSAAPAPPATTTAAAPTPSASPAAPGSGAATTGTTAAPAGPVYRSAIVYAVRTKSLKGEESPWSNSLVLVPQEPPPTPVDQVAKALENGIDLTWTASAGAKTYGLLRRLATMPEWGAPLGTVGGDATHYLDATAVYGNRYVYSVVAMAAVDPPIESVPAVELEVDYRDVFPPTMPTELHAIVLAGKVRLIWNASTSKDVAGYWVERAGADGKFQRLTAAPVTDLETTDTAAPRGVTSTYHVVAVDAAGNLSTPSAPAQAQPR